MRESSVGSCEIPECYDVVRAFLYYLYTDNLQISGEAAEINGDSDDDEWKDDDESAVMLLCDLLHLSNLYDIPRLTLLITNRLRRAMNIANVAFILQTAWNTRTLGLKTDAMHFVLKNLGKCVRILGFAEMSKELIVEVVASIPQSAGWPCVNAI